MVTTTSINSNNPQVHLNDIMTSSIESGCVENVFFTVKNLYTGKRTLRQVRQDEITKVSFILGQLATQVNTSERITLNFYIFVYFIYIPIYIPYTIIISYYMFLLKNVVVKELMFLICALIGEIPLSESFLTHGQQSPPGNVFSTKV